MPNIAPPGDIFSGSGDPFMDAAKKAELANARTPLGVVGVSIKSTNQFGDDETRFIVQARGERYTLCLSHNDVRERQATAIAQLLAAGHDAVGPVYLVQVTTKGGKTAWALDDQPMAEGLTVAARSANGGEAAASQVTGPVSSGVGSDDDIPF